ncbi:MAG: hypothetical protein SF028_10930 [Candidatus Sumerlaeia bacterium]|nr:hypothetical protein [Candidatus Sumerlaeia bacterium]
MESPADASKASWAGRCLHSTPFWAAATLSYIIFIYRNLLFDLAGADSRHLLHWDTTWYHWPILVYISDCFRAGLLPSWLPFMSTGYPIIGDPQSQMWSPITLGVAFTFGYSFFVVQLQMVAQTMLAGLGCYALGRRLGWMQAVCALFGILYVTSGHFLSTYQYFGIMAIYQALPWLLLLLLRLLDSPTIGGVGAYALVMGAASHAGHPGTFLIMNLNLGVLSIGYCLLRKKPLMRSFGAMLVALMLAGGMAWVMAGSTLSIAQYTNRIGHEYTYAEIMLWEALYPKTLISLLSPSSAVVEARDFFVSDIAMNNHYLGVLVLLTAPAVLAGRLKRWQVGLLIMISVNFAAALGHYGYLRWLIAKLPLFDSIHHPSANFRGFAFFFLFMLCCQWLHELFGTLENAQDSKRVCCSRLQENGLQASIVCIPILVLVSYAVRQFFAKGAPLHAALSHDFVWLLALLSITMALLIAATVLPKWRNVTLLVILLLTMIDLERASRIAWVTVADDFGPEGNAKVWARYRNMEAQRPNVTSLPAFTPRIDNREAVYTDNESWITRDQQFLKNTNQMRLSSTDAALANPESVRKLLLGPEGKMPVYWAPRDSEVGLIHLRDVDVVMFQPALVKLKLPELMPVGEGRILVGEAWIPGWGYRYESGEEGEIAPADTKSRFGRAIPYERGFGRDLEMFYNPPFFKRYALISLVCLIVALLLALHPAFVVMKLKSSRRTMPNSD